MTLLAGTSVELLFDISPLAVLEGSPDDIDLHTHLQSLLRTLDGTAVATATHWLLRESFTLLRPDLRYSCSTPCVQSLVCACGL